MTVDTSALSGNLTFLPLPDILQLLHTSSCSGILRVKSPYSLTPGVVYFEKGAPIDALALEKSGLDALYELFGWVDGSFSFSTEKVNASRVIKTGMMEIILDGTRMLDDGKIVKQGPRDASVQEDESTTDGSNLPIIRRPISNYSYVLDEEEVPNGQNIVTQGRHGDWICVMLNGYADVIRQTKKDGVTITRLGPGSLIGNISSLMSTKSVRTATLVARGRVSLGVLDMQRIHTEFSILTPQFRTMAVSLDKRLLQATDTVVDIHLGMLNPKEAIAGKRLLMEQGAMDETVQIIEEGEVCVVRQTKQGPIPLAYLEKGDYVGNIPCMNTGHEPSGAALYVSEDVRLAPVNLEAIQEEYDLASPMIKAILDHVAACVSVTTLIACDFEKMTRRR
ncbi:MAG: cyclic nucleotide-binding domain-containing protein [Desulfatibacillum sp.]|nr:cyclic nucleotide-binding domain-containing protein [Desulfatibacillum sp.]